MKFFSYSQKQNNRLYIITFASIRKLLFTLKIALTQIYSHSTLICFYIRWPQEYTQKLTFKMFSDAFHSEYISGGGR